MIPNEIKADKLKLAAVIDQWRLEVISTNWSGYWIIQLLSEKGSHLAMLINFDQLAAICVSVRACIEAASNPDQYPNTKTMIQMVAANLPTQDDDSGAISVLSDWEEQPYLLFSYYRNRSATGNVIRQALGIEDAKELYDCFARIYNSFPTKLTWPPLIP